MDKSEEFHEFGSSKPRVIILDDDARALKAATGELRSEGFEVSTCTSVAQFHQLWSPGLFDLVVADWDLSADEKGDAVLLEIRGKDWDVPFILVSGRLEEDDEKSPVFFRLLELGNADFVERGDDGIQKICEKAIKLIAKRDLALLRVILRLRESALKDVEIETSSGKLSARAILAEVVKDPRASHESEGPIAARIANRTLGVTK